MVSQVVKLLRKERVPASTLYAPAQEVLAGTLGVGEADLGAGLFKKRVARPGGGKSGGYRAIIAYRPPRADRVLVIHVFAKNAASTLTPHGHAAFAAVARDFVSASDEQVVGLLSLGDLTELTCDGDHET